jgi:hypothetical protein
MTQRKQRTIVVAVCSALVVAGSATVASGGRGASGTRLPRGSEPVKIDPADFSPNIDNRQWPMRTGSRWVYRVTDMATGSVERQVITVTSRTKVMADGVRARVVTDVVTDHGKPAEVTEDWYAQDREGNVWYFGENTTAFKDGKRTDNGSWQAGVGGAMPGVALPAKPTLGLSYREEYSKGVAEDQSRILALDAQAQVHAGHYKNVVLAEDFSPIEPDVSELKFYAKGSGQAVLAIDVSGGSDREELITYTR